MVEAAAFLFLAYLVVKCSPLFQPVPAKDRLICWGTVFHSLMDDGPFHWEPGTYQATEPDNTDPNSNPHYAWAQEDDSQ